MIDQWTKIEVSTLNISRILGDYTLNGEDEEGLKVHGLVYFEYGSDAINLLDRLCEYGTENDWITIDEIREMNKIEY